MGSARTEADTKKAHAGILEETVGLDAKKWKVTERHPNVTARTKALWRLQSSDLPSVACCATRGEQRGPCSVFLKKVDSEMQHWDFLVSSGVHVPSDRFPYMQDAGQ